jgi:Toastrack DUF4097
MAVTTASGTTASGTSFRLTRGRLVALAIGVPVCLLLIANTGLSLVANVGQGSYPVGYTVPAAARSLAVTLSGGQLTVTGAASGPARVAGTAHYSLVRAHLTEGVTAGGARVGYECVFPYGNCDLDAAVTAPAGLPVTAHTDGGDVQVTGTAGPVTLTTGGGNVSASRVAGPLTVETDGGNVQATGITAAVTTVHTGGGDIDITFATVPRDVHVAATGGNVTINLPRGDAEYHVISSTGGGNTTDTVNRNTASPNLIAVDTGGGDITIQYQQ